MNRDPILFRVDGTPRLGWEHLARCQTLAAALQRRRRPTYFLSQLEPASLALPLKRAGNDWLDADAPAGTPLISRASCSRGVWATESISGVCLIRSM